MPERRIDGVGPDFFPNCHILESARTDFHANVFLAILRDIKKDIDNGKQPGEAVTAAMFQAMRDALDEQKKNPLSIDDVTAMIARQIGQLAPMDKETVEMFQQFAKKMITQTGKNNLQELDRE